MARKYQSLPQKRVNGVPINPLRLDFGGNLNHFWKIFNDENVITFNHYDYLHRESKVFTMGSCFAVEIRKALAEAGIDVYPKYTNIKFNPAHCLIGALPQRDNINHYHTFSMRQEFEKYHGEWTQGKDDVWILDDYIWGTKDKVFQDPYRRSIFGRKQKFLISAIESLDTVIFEGMKSADVFLLTLGLIEVWKKKDDGRFACEYPGYNRGGGQGKLDFYLSSFADNYQNTQEIIKLIRKINPDANIVLTVSPVWLGKTFSTNDIYVANMESKSVLRSVAGQICREDEGVYYFPSFEIASALHGLGHETDGRHVRENTVFDITNAFLFTHSGGRLDRK